MDFLNLETFQNRLKIFFDISALIVTTRDDRDNLTFWAHQIRNNSDGQFIQIGNIYP